MANFHTHLNVGIFVSGGAVVWLHGSGLAPADQTLVLFALGVTGSLLPDIDADASAPVRATFAVLGAVLAFAWTLPLMGRFLPLELGLIWAGLFLGVRFLLQAAFARFTVHRGIWHSWLATAFVTLATVDLAYWLLKQPPHTAWVAGSMVGLGYFAHLCLDELYSVDLLNSRVNRAFGTALKPFSFSDPLSSLAMAATVGGLLWIAPESHLLQRIPALQVWTQDPLTAARDLAIQTVAELRVLLD